MFGLSKLPHRFDRPSRSNVPVLSKSALHPQGNSLAIEAKVVTMWKSLLERGQAWRRTQLQPRMFSKTELVPNETGVGCLDNDHVLLVDMSIPGAAKKPIHAHCTRQKSHGVEPGQVIYAAGQSPPVASFKDFLAQALSSKQGIFEIVSRKTHYDPDHSSAKSIIDLLKMEIAKLDASHNELTFGNRRYEYRGFNQVAGKGCVNNEKDFLRYELSVIDHATGIEITVPLTQAGLKFSDKLLRPAEIRRANSLLNAHQDAVTSCGHVDQTGSPPVQLILSRAGSGRNATLISYHNICHLIENRLVTEDTLDVVLEEEIVAQRMRRGPGYVHSMGQLASLRTALLDKMAADAQITPLNVTKPLRRASAPGWLGQTISTARDMGSPRLKEASQTSDRSSNVTALPVKDNGKNVEINTPITDLADPVLPHSADGRSFAPIEMPGHNLLEQSADAAEDIFFHPAAMQGHSQTEQSKNISPGEIVKTGSSTEFDGALIQDDPIDLPLRTRYTNDQIDMEKADHLLLGPEKGINIQRQLFTDDGGSWWRAAFVSVLIEQAVQSPNGLDYTEQAAQKIAERIRELGTDFSEEATIVEQMMMQMINPFFVDGTSGKGIRGFMTDLQPRMGGKELNLVDPMFLGNVSRLKAVGEDDNDPGQPGETALKKIAHAMLLKAGFNPTTVNALFDENSNEEGTTAHIVELMNQLGAREGIIYTRPWVQPDQNSSGYARLDFKAVTLDMYAMNNPLGPKRFVDPGIHRGDEVQKFIYPHANKPVIVAEHGHFSILIDYSEATAAGYT